MSEQSERYLSPEEEAKLQCGLRRKRRRAEAKYGWPRGHMLIVTDDPFEAHLLEFLADCEGYASTLASTEEEAIAVLRSALHPLVVLLPLPTWFGDLTWSVLAAVRAAGDTWAPHRLIGSGWYPPPDLEELAAAVGMRVVAPPAADAITATINEAAASILAADISPRVSSSSR